MCLNWFHDWGFPCIIRSDNGPQFRQKFSDQSPYNPASNGLAEAAVKNVKFLLKKCLAAKESFSHVLLHWRNVPRSDGISPSQAFLLFPGEVHCLQLPTLSSQSSLCSLSEHFHLFIQEHLFKLLFSRWVLLPPKPPRLQKLTAFRRKQISRK